MTHFKNENKPVSFDSCEVKKSRYSEKMEVLVTRKTAIASYSRKLDFGDHTADTSKKVVADCNNIQDMEDYELVCLPAVKVIKINSQMDVKPGLHKQDILIADHVGSIK